MADTLEDVYNDEEPAATPEAAAEKPDVPEMSDASAEERDIKDKESAFGEIAAFLKRYSPPPAVHGRQDMLDDRYIIHPSRLVQELSKNLAAACEAEDGTLRDRRLFAMLLPKELPYRLRNIEILSGHDHPNLLPLVAAGNVQYSADDTIAMVAVYERPSARTIRELLRDRKTGFTEQFVIDEVITPLNDVLMYFMQKGISHGCINIDTVYLGERVQLGECVAEPCGYAQNFHFESPERAQALPLGKGEATVVTDCYALGILVLHLLMGTRYFERLEAGAFLDKRLTLGSYNTLVEGREFKTLEDFLKGVLNDDPLERWTPEHIDQWLKGKKYNLLTPSVLREGQRPFSFLGEDYFNRRSLAHSLVVHWEDAKPVLKNTHLSRWVEVSLHKTELADLVRKVVDRTGGIHNISEKANNELVARTICLLDPEGPVRYNQISAFVDGTGVLLADAFRERDQKRIQLIIEMLDYNFYNYINDLLDGAKTKRHGNILWRMQSCSRYLRMQTMGFGVERVLYELNPTLPCQSELLKNENVLTNEELLYALDRIGTRKSRSFEYLDRHIAAFAAVRLGITKEMKLQDIKRIPALAQNPQLVVIQMLAQAQHKAGRPRLKGLTSWAALRVIPLIDNFHSRTIRRKLRDNLKAAAKTGELDKIFDIIIDMKTINEDIQGFRKAVHRFSRNARDIARLENEKRLTARAEQLGLIFALIVSYSTLLITASVVLKNYILGQ